MGEAEPHAGPALRIEALVKRFGARPALDEVSLQVARGEAFALVGANGAGKTTLMRCLLDLAACERGRIEIFGVPSAKPESRRRLCYLPERFTPPHYLRAAEFLRATLELAGARYDEARAARLLEELELERALLAQPVRSLSKGSAQKLGLAGCFLVERDLYVLDEPMSGLDPAARVAVKSVLARLSAEGRTLFFTSHVLADVEELCSAIGILHRARLRFRGAPAELCARYAERNLERAFMRCIRDEQAVGA
jgi:ABC-2 type transport system ATP-binding protein